MAFPNSIPLGMPNDVTLRQSRDVLVGAGEGIVWHRWASASRIDNEWRGRTDTNHYQAIPTTGYMRFVDNRFRGDATETPIGQIDNTRAVLHTLFPIQNTLDYIVYQGREYQVENESTPQHLGRSWSTRLSLRLQDEN